MDGRGCGTAGQRIGGGPLRVAPAWVQPARPRRSRCGGAGVAIRRCSRERRRGIGGGYRAPHDTAVTLAASPLPGWNELLALHRGPAGWTADTLTPATIDPELGYVELAGISPDGAHLFVVREARASGPLGSPNTLAPWIAR